MEDKINKLGLVNKLDPEREVIIKEAGAKLGINTTGELLDPRFDYVFKRIFTAQEKESKAALIDFLNSVLFGGANKITDLTVVNNELPVDSYNQKKSRFDIRIIFENGEQALVEMEFRAKDDFIRRSLHNASRMYSSQPINRLNYRKLKRCYMVCVMGYNVFNDDYGYINTFTFRDERGRELSDDMQITYIELEKTNDFVEKPAKKLTNAECWGLFLQNASYDDKRQVLDKITEKNGGIKMAVDVLRYISKSDIERMRYEDEILAEIDHEAEFSYRLKEIAKSLLDVLDAETIARKFDLTIEEVETLRESE